MILRMSETTQALISFPALHCTKKKRSNTALFPSRKCEILSTPHQSILEDIFGISNMIKCWEKAFFPSCQGHLPAIVDNHITTLYEYSYQKLASNCCYRPQ